MLRFEERTTRAGSRLNPFTSLLAIARDATDVNVQARPPARLLWNDPPAENPAARDPRSTRSSPRSFAPPPPPQLAAPKSPAIFSPRPRTAQLLNSLTLAAATGNSPRLFVGASPRNEGGRSSPVDGFVAALLSGNQLCFFPVGGRRSTADEAANEPALLGHCAGAEATTAFHGARPDGLPQSASFLRNDQR